jgi:hypothetical protein
MKFIKQSSIDNLIDETLTLLLEPLTKKKGVHYFCFSPLRAKRNSFFMCACCKNFFMTTQGFRWKLRAVHHEKIPNDELLWSCRVAEITGIVLEYEEQSEDAKKIHDEILSMKRSFNFALINTKNSTAYKQMIGQNKWCSLIAVSLRDIARIYDWLCSWWKKLCFYSTNQ